MPGIGNLVRPTMNIRPATVTAADASTSPGPTPQTMPPPRMRLASASESFILGIDTCGFTSESTCYCTNIGDARGCCTGSPADCSASIWTTCRGYTEGGDGYCGAYTLCCAAALPACITYYFTTKSEPGETLTNVGCGTSAMYGQMYPLPPELMPTTSDEDHRSATDLSVNPIETSGSESEKAQPTNPTGAIVGAIVGGVLLVALAILACVLLAKRRRRRQEQQQISKELISGPTDFTNVAPTTGAPEKSGGGVANSLRTRLRLSTIHEHNGPLPASPMLARYKSARRSYGPDWPLGSADLLESHPVAVPAVPAAAANANNVDLEKRLSEPRRGSAPQLQISAFPATRLAPAQPPKSPPGGASPSQQQQHMPAAPSSPGVEKRVSDIDGAAAAAATTGTADSNSSYRNSSRPPKISQIRTSTKLPPRNSAQQDEPVSPIEQSPVEGGGRGGDPKRLSLVSAPSFRDSRFIGTADDLVSPVSPDDDEERGGERGGMDSGRSDGG
ncbi:hypothetical protein PG994_012206 [Apiospora phragmitis]|uniref:Uncharacterized protein n=1 Tax=Apiospora phragmitis TaxID=2905665 RepID=A0ABR1TV04_9PEZI